MLTVKKGVFAHNPFIKKKKINQKKWSEISSVHGEVKWPYKSSSNSYNSSNYRMANPKSFKDNGNFSLALKAFFFNMSSLSFRLPLHMVSVNEKVNSCNHISVLKLLIVNIWMFLSPQFIIQTLLFPRERLWLNSGNTGDEFSQCPYRIMQISWERKMKKMRIIQCANMSKQYTIFFYSITMCKIAF